MRTRRTIRKGRAGLIPKATRPTLQENRQLHSQTAFAVAAGSGCVPCFMFLRQVRTRGGLRRFAFRPKLPDGPL